MKRTVLAWLLALMMLLSLAACGGSKASNESGGSTSAATADSASWDEEMPMEPELGFDSGAASDGAAIPSGQKLIRTAQLELETTDFDKTVEELTALTQRVNGYFESNDVNKRSGGRWASFTIRVPADAYDAFLEQAGSLCHELWRSAQQEDISERYYDTQGRLKTQQIKLERLQALLAKAEKMEDIITLESAISETEQAIDDLSGTLRSYDGQVDYATVNITLDEVYKLSEVDEVPVSFASRLGKAFAGGWTTFTDGLENLTVALAYGWMWLLTAALIAVVVIRLVRRHRTGPMGKKPDDKSGKL